MDEQELESWLNTRPREDAILIAQRAALRVFPIWASQMGQGWARDHDLTFVTLLRCDLTAGVARKYSAPEVKAAVKAAVAAVRITPTINAAASAGASAASAARATTTSITATTATSTTIISGVAIAAAESVGIAAIAAIEIWGHVERDLVLLTEGKDLLSAPLWHSDAPEQVLRAEVQGLENLAPETGDRNSFWHRWYFAAKRGEWLDWKLQRDVALIPDEVWKQGPKAVMAAIAEIEARHALPFSLHRELAEQPPPAKGAVAAVQQAMQRNRQALPPTFDAIQGLIALEIERLLGRNYTDELDLIECQRQIGIFVALHDAISALRENLPATGSVSEAQAAASESVMRLYWRKFQELPQTKADEVVEGVWATGAGAIRLGLIGATATLAASYGLPILAGVTLGSLIFAPKSAADLIKAAREGLPPKP